MGDRNQRNEVLCGARLTRRRLLRTAAATSAIGLGAAILPATWRGAFGDAKPYKLGTVQPLTGVAAYGGKSSLLGVQMAVDRINKSGGIIGRPVELFIGDDESKPDTGRRAVEKMALSDTIEVITRNEPAFRAAELATIDELCDRAWSTTIQRPIMSRRWPTSSRRLRASRRSSPIWWRTWRTSSPAATRSPPGGS